MLFTVNLVLGGAYGENIVRTLVTMKEFVRFMGLSLQNRSILRIYSDPFPDPFTSSLSSVIENGILRLAKRPAVNTHSSLSHRPCVIP